MADPINTLSHRGIIGAFVTIPAVALVAGIPTSAGAGVTHFEAAYQNWPRLLAAHLEAIRICDVAVDAHYADRGSFAAEAAFIKADTAQKAACHKDWDAMMVALNTPAANLNEVLRKVEIVIDQHVDAEHIKGIKYDLMRLGADAGAYNRTSA